MVCYQVFAKTPLEGVVKTRLAQGVGKRHAAWVQRALLRRVLMAPAPGERRLELWCAPVCAHPLFSCARSRLGWRLRRQVGRDLGARMAYALDAALRRGDSVLLMGCDLPMLSAAQLQYVERRLSVREPVVILPTRDGGFGLLAAHASVGRWPHRALRYVRWGSAVTLAQVCSRLGALGMTPRLLPVSWDVDMQADLRRWQRVRYVQGERGVLPRYPMPVLTDVGRHHGFGLARQGGNELND